MAAFQLAARNVAYYAVCFLDKLIQVLDAKHIRLDWLHIVFGQHLIEYRRDVHCGATPMPSKSVGTE
jgi:hypothetical protein